MQVFSIVQSFEKDHKDTTQVSTKHKALFATINDYVEKYFRIYIETSNKVTIEYPLENTLSELMI